MGTQPQQSPTSTRSTTSPLPSPSDHRGDDETHDLYSPGPTLTAAPADAVSAVDAFARAWARQDLDAATWWAGVAPLCTQRLADQLRTTDPGRVPAAAVTGRPAPVGAVRADAATFAVPADTGTITVGVVRADNDRWLVASIDFTASVR